jgi:hypothetical protein
MEKVLRIPVTVVTPVTPDGAVISGCSPPPPAAQLR